MLRDDTTVGESEMASGLNQDPAPLVVHNHRPVVEAEVLLEGNAVFLADREAHGGTVL